ncbi:MAG TPA: MMPL family transporter, partial [Planctomycetaceae bacterium]|nr:MMPL family transporter [Planctomycetaceae bacterium]
PEGSGISFKLTGDAYVNAMAMNSVIRDLFYSLLTASLVIFGLIAAIFRSIRIGIIASIPNLTPLALTLGYMALRGYDMNVGNVIVFTISLGIAVDDSIHFLFRFREEMKQTTDVSEAVRLAFAGTGRAILVTSILIVTGLSVLLLSDFVPTRRFAELTSITMIGALIGDLFLLPACLLVFWKKPA